MQFADEYKKLNAAQKMAVDAIDGPVMVIAGPGTGKTKILTLRIANILTKTDTPPEAVLALTFTEKATHEMRTRLVALIGQAAYRVRIRTFHSFCNEIIQSEPDQFPHIIGGSAITETDQLGLIESIMQELELPLLLPLGRPEAYVKAIKGAIEDLKREGYDPEKFSGLVKQEEKAFMAIDDVEDDNGKVRAKYRALEKSVRKQRELAFIFAEYRKSLAAGNLYDYADMLTQVADVMEIDGQLRLSLQEKFLYILVDEHQDTNRTQNRIVRLIGESDISSERPNIFAVGDIQQAIYRFQGASLANFRDFTTRYPKAVVVRLDENYRSTQAILEAAVGISPSQGKLTAKSGHPEKPVELFAFSTPSVQEYAVAGMIAEKIKRGTPANEIAILYRTNAEAASFAGMLEKFGIPSALESDDEVLDDLNIQKLLTVARAVAGMDKPGLLLEALQADFLGVSPLDSAKLGAYAYKNRLNPWDVLRSPEILDNLNLENKKHLSGLYNVFTRIAARMANSSATEGLQHLVNETGFLPHILNRPDGERVLAKLHSFYELIRSQMESNKSFKLGDFLKTLELLAKHKSSLRARVVTPDNAVRLMTVFKAKGLEFDTVFTVNVVHGHWDGARKPAELKLPDEVWRLSQEIADDLEDDTESDMRNLFYVALTRARREAIITWAQRREDGKEQSPSIFTLAIPDEYKITADTARWEDDYAGHKDIQFKAAQSKPNLKNKEYLSQLFLEQGLSVTALNNFLECPWKYYFKNLVRITEEDDAIAPEYGKATHAALKAFFDKMKKDGDPGKPYLIDHFVRSLRRAPKPQNLIDRAVKDGQAALSGWYDEYSDNFHTNVLTEERIDGVELDKIPLNGNLDKIEILPDGKVNVVDYKTKEPMSANAIMGKPKDATGNEFRQLVFYKILLDRQGKYKMASGEIDFLESNEAGKYKKEKFHILPEHTDALEKQIRDVSRQITELSFWNETCGEPDCRYCRLRSMMKSDD